MKSSFVLGRVVGALALVLCVLASRAGADLTLDKEPLDRVEVRGLEAWGAEPFDPADVRVRVLPVPNGHIAAEQDEQGEEGEAGEVGEVAPGETSPGAEAEADEAPAPSEAAAVAEGDAAAGGDADTEGDESAAEGDDDG